MSATPDIPRQAGQALAVLQRRLGPALLAVYLHGSARGGGLRPQSDVDLLAVADGPLAADARGPLTRDLMALSAYPARSESMRPLEILVFDRHDLDPLPYPARSEFVYGEWLRPGFEAGGVPLPLADPELTIVLAQARQAALPLFGPAPRQLLPEVPQHDLRRAMADALPALMAGLEGDERNVLLTLARMWRTAVSGDIVAKDAAAAWAADRLPTQTAQVLALARAAYLDGAETDWTARRRQVGEAARVLRARVESAL